MKKGNFTRKPLSKDTKLNNQVTKPSKKAGNTKGSNASVTFKKSGSVAR